MKRVSLAFVAGVATMILMQAGLAPRTHRGPRAANPVIRLWDREKSLSARELDPNPEGNAPMEDPANLAGPAPFEAEQAQQPDLQKPLLPKDEGEKRIMEALEESRNGPRYANVSTADGRLLRQLTEAVGAKRVVELGTSTGESGLWFSMALRKTGGHLYTHDIDAERIKVARKNFERGGVQDLITIIEGDAHETVKQHKDPIDVLFIDADKPGYPDYLAKLLPVVRPGGLIIAHNMRRPPPDPRYIEAITTNPDLDTSFVLMDSAGIGITLKKR